MILFETGSHSIAKADLKLSTSLPLSPKSAGMRFQVEIGHVVQLYIQFLLYVKNLLLSFWPDLAKYIYVLISLLNIKK